MLGLYWLWFAGVMPLSLAATLIIVRLSDRHRD
jgi:hypothetical protein